MEIKFFVPGIPAPGGSKKAFYNPKTKKISVVDDCKRNKPWRERVASFAYNHRPDNLIACAIDLSVDFIMPRPKSHYGVGRNCDKLKPSAPKFCTKKPDATKLLRALEDALTGMIWRDDSQIVKQTVRKHWGEKPGALVKISKII